MSLPSIRPPAVEWRAPSVRTQKAVDGVLVTHALHLVLIRSSLSSAPVGVTPAAWRDFLNAVKRGEFDDLAPSTIDMEESPCSQPPLPA